MSDGGGTSSLLPGQAFSLNCILIYDNGQYAFYLSQHPRHLSRIASFHQRRSTLVRGIYAPRHRHYLHITSYCFANPSCSRAAHFSRLWIYWWSWVACGHSRAALDLVDRLSGVYLRRNPTTTTGTPGHW